MTEDTLRLDPVDAEFLEKIIRRVTNSNALPFEVPRIAMPDIINRALAKAYELDSEATESKWLIVPSAEITSKRKLNRNQNAEVKLPDCIAAVFQLYTTAQSFGLGISSTDFARAVIFQTYATNYRTYGYQPPNQDNSNFRGGYGTDHPTVSSNIVAMFEYSMYKSTFTKGIRFNYNQYSNTLNVQGQHNNASLVLDCMVKLDKQDVYKSIWFQDYVTGLTMQALSDIISTYDFVLPGNVKINVEKIESRGEKLVDKVEEFWKENQANDMIFSS